MVHIENSKALGITTLRRLTSSVDSQFPRRAYFTGESYYREYHTHVAAEATASQQKRKRPPAY